MTIARQAKIFKAIGDEVRLKILQSLPCEPHCDNMCNVGKLVEQVGGSQPNISRHLQILKDAGLVQCRKDCSSVFYWRDPAAFEEARTLLKKFADGKHGFLAETNRNNTYVS